MKQATLRTYRQTIYQAAGEAAWVGCRSPGLHKLLSGRPGVFIAAWNPRSRLTPPGRNARMDRALQAWLRRHPHWPGHGTGRNWREAHDLVQIDPRQALTLARRFRQAAVTLVGNGPTRLLLLPPPYPPTHRSPPPPPPPR